MNDNTVYDVPINEVAKILDKSDRQVRRYVKERRLNAKPIRVDGHIKLLFNHKEVVAFKDNSGRPDAVTPQVEPTFIDAQLIDDMEDLELPVQEAKIIDGADTSDGTPVKYVIDILKDQIDNLRKENQDLHYQLEQRSGLVGFWQGKAEVLQEEVKALSPVPKPEEEPKPIKKPIWKFW
ncbi:MAG: helix-turn-helix domain-containing protein [Armatimonadota bacterium]